MQLFSFKKSFLKKQKVSKRNSKKESKKKKSRGNLNKFFLAFLLAFLSLFIFFVDKKNYAKKTVTLDPNWEITISFSPKANRENSKTIKSLVATGFKNKTLLQLTDDIQKKHPFSRTTVIQVAPKKLHVLIKNKTATMYILADKKRLVSQAGEVYGSEKDSTEENLPLLQGIFPKKRGRYVFSKNNSLRTSKDEENKIEKALLIQAESKKNNLQLAKISFTPYRGFSIILKNGSKVVLGSGPFPYKIKKFIEITKSLAKQNKKATYVELDYNGKAFIKTSNTGI